MRDILGCCGLVRNRRLVLTLNLLTTTIVVPPSNASKWQIFIIIIYYAFMMGINSVFKGLICVTEGN